MKRVAALVAALILVFPSVAFGHAALVRTVPSASGTVNTPPTSVQLTFSEAVEPRFASISVTDAAAKQLVADKPTRDEKTLTVPLRKLDEGWYLVYWRVISQDGHPVRGAYTFAVGPNPGPAPQFVIPSISETAATPGLLTARWIALLGAMTAIGLFVFRILIARPAATRRLTLAFAVAAVVALIAAPVYLVIATAQFSLRSVTDLGDVIPLLNVSSFGHGFLMLELCLALFAVSAGIALWVDRPDRPVRSIAELLATSGALLAALAVLILPGTSGHPGTTSPRGLAITLDVIHLSAGSIWIGGLIGLLVLWRQAGPIVHRFSNTALASVALLITTGTIAALLHLPTLSSLWDTGWGQALLVKIGLLLARPRAGGAQSQARGGRARGRGGRARGRRGVRGGGADQRGAAGEGARRSRQARGHRRSRPRRREDHPERLYARRARRSEQGGGQQPLLDRPQQGRKARHRGEPDRRFRHAGHGDGSAILQTVGSRAGYV